jgi:hypothetical protein
MNDNAQLQTQITLLSVEHRDLDVAIEMLVSAGHTDELQLQRLKKRKLQLKDHMKLLQMQLIPDEPA